MASKKRQKIEKDGDGDDTKDDELLNYLEGDDFIPEDQLRGREAEKRRQERQRRLQNFPEREELLSKPEITKTKVKEEITVKQGAVGPGIAVGRDDKNEKDNDDEEEEEEGDDDGFDMFSSSVSPVVAVEVTAKASAAAITEEGTQQDWDDTEGYYKAVIGEVITIDSINDSNDDNGNSDVDISFRVLGVVGKGVFSTVLKCTTISNATSVPLPPTVAIKCIRHNETMAKTAYSEIRYLQRLKNSPGIVPLLLPMSSTPLEHKGHVLLVFPCADHNLRDVLHRFGKGVGLSLEAVRSYFGQLIAAVSHLKKHSLIHADLKPDNILVSQDFSVVQLGDFGSALDVSSADQQQQPAPYLVSRFYRAPEIILGLVPTYAIDLWSLAVSVAELFLGDVLFRGRTNNDMIYVFMQHLGPFSNRLIRQHLVQCQKMPIAPQFTQRQEGAGNDYQFIQAAEDPVTGKPVNKYVSLFSSSTHTNGDSNHEVFPSTPLSKKLLKAKSAKDSRTMVLRFSDLLQKCLALDPSRRISLKDALQHDFFTKAVPTTTANGGSANASSG